MSEIRTFERTKRSKSERYRTERAIIRISALSKIRTFGFRMLTVLITYFLLLLQKSLKKHLVLQDLYKSFCYIRRSEAMALQHLLQGQRT